MQMIAKHAAEMQDLKNQLDAERASLKAEMEERARQTVEVVEENARKKIETLEAENKRLKKTSVSKDNLQVSFCSLLRSSIFLAYLFKLPAHVACHVGLDTLKEFASYILIPTSISLVLMYHVRLARSWHGYSFANIHLCFHHDVKTRVPKVSYNICTNLIFI